MKKSNLFLVLLTAIIVMSCSKDETTMSIPQESNAIEFGTYVGRDAQTRASVLDDAALKLSGFGVFAHYTAQDSYASAKPNFMYNQEVTWGTTWGYTPVKYWPNNTDDKVSFFAYAPYSSTTTPNNISDFVPTSTNTGDPTLKFTVNDVVKSQADLVWGVKSGDGLPFLNQTKQTITEDIKFTFKHALARIGFNVEAMVDLVNDDATGAPDDGTTGNGAIATETKIVVTKVELIGSFYPSGTLNLNNTAANTPLWTPGTAAVRTFELTPTDNFETVADHGEATFTTNGQLVASATAKQKLNNDDSYIMVIPQNFASTDKIKIKVTYDVITEDTSLDTGQSKVTNAITSSDFNFNFEHGKAYTFNLHLGMTSVKFDVTVTPWNTTEPEIVVNVPVNTVKIEAPSNSYIVAPNSLGIYIPVSIANASLLGEQLGVADDFTAELVWTDNENKIADNSNIAEIGTGRQDLAGYLFVKPGSAEGNAVVAIKNADNKIVWSWHIWVTNQKPASIGMFMDRNLGAIGNTPGAFGTLGLLYQWGRKDPFPSSTTVDGNIEPIVYNTLGVVAINKIATTAPSNFANSVANPFTFYKGVGTNGNDWYSSSSDTRNDALWGYGVGVAKTVYDPCPEGWRMPDKGAYDENVLDSIGAWEIENRGRTHSIHGGFFPAAGSRNNDGGLKDFPSAEHGNPYRAYYWTNRPKDNLSSSFNFGAGYKNTFYEEGGRAVGCSVRCVKE